MLLGSVMYSQWCAPAELTILVLVYICWTLRSISWRRIWPRRVVWQAIDVFRKRNCEWPLRVGSGSAFAEGT